MITKFLSRQFERSEFFGRAFRECRKKDLLHRMRPKMLWTNLEMIWYIYQMERCGLGTRNVGANHRYIWEMWTPSIDTRSREVVKEQVVRMLNEHYVVDTDMRLLFITAVLKDQSQTPHHRPMTCLQFKQELFLPSFDWIRLDSSEVMTRHMIGLYSVNLTNSITISWHHKKPLPHHLCSIYLFRVYLVVTLRGKVLLRFVLVSYNRHARYHQEFNRPMEIMYGQTNDRYVEVNDFINNGDGHFLTHLGRDLPNRKRLYRNRHVVFITVDLPLLLQLYEVDIDRPKLNPKYQI
jgi:hypothetical protein